MSGSRPVQGRSPRGAAPNGGGSRVAGVPHRRPARRHVSLVFPMFNEGANVVALRRRLAETLKGLPAYDFEIVLVDDHSTDDTRAQALAWSQDDPRVRYLRLSRNFGSHAAITAGLHAADGDCALFLAADLQDPPELIPLLLDRWEAGFRVVWAVRTARNDTHLVHRCAAKLFWWVMRLGAQEATPPQPADFALLDRKAIDAYGRMTSRNESLIAAICWLGFSQTTVPYQKAVRDRGRSGWTFSKKCKLCIDSIVGFSYWPIRAMSLLGIGCAGIGFLLLVYTVWHRLAGYTTVPGWAGLMSALLTGMGILMVMVGVLGEYLWRVLDETRGRPKYILEEAHGLDRTRRETARFDDPAAFRQPHPCIAGSSHESAPSAGGGLTARPVGRP